jgi:hypothetical protein
LREAVADAKQRPGKPWAAGKVAWHEHPRSGLQVPSQHSPLQTSHEVPSEKDTQEIFEDFHQKAIRQTPNRSITNTPIPVHFPIFLADAGVPMIALAVPAALFSIIPIIGLEFWMARNIHPLSHNRRLFVVAVANGLSTLAGWPLLWIVLAAIQLFVIPGGSGCYGLSSFWGALASVTLQAPWLIPYESDLYWMLPTASLVLLIPAFFVTILIEGWVLRSGWPQVLAAERSRFVWKSNLASYALLVSIDLVWLAYSVLTKNSNLCR